MAIIIISPNEIQTTSGIKTVESLYASIEYMQFSKKNDAVVQLILYESEIAKKNRGIPTSSMQIRISEDLILKTIYNLVEQQLKSQSITFESLP